MAVKKYLLKLYNWHRLTNEETDKNQEEIRITEWNAIRENIKVGKFLDVGCGAGYNLHKAKYQLQCDVYGIDPAPGEHGVGRYNEHSILSLRVLKGVSESLPFEDNFFDTVFSSHVLEHVSDIDKTLSEIGRVLKNDGIIILGMPTNTMAKINLVTQYLFFTHQRIVNAIFKGVINTGAGSFKQIFFPPSHSHIDESIYFDIKFYAPANWKSYVGRHFQIQEIIFPLVYPYPETLQFFKPYKSDKTGSSIFFICKKSLSK